jgi:uncharacterized protein (DUF2141 family)
MSPASRRGAAAILTWVCCGYAAAQTASLTVILEGVDTDQEGTLVVAVYADETSWLDLERAIDVRELAPVATTITATFEELEPGQDYAVQVIHDENGNRALDMRRFPFPAPKEGAAISNDAFRMGPPRFEDARFTLDAPSVEIKVPMRY